MDSSGDDLPVSGGPALSFGFNLGRIAGAGEDSDPVLRDGRELGLVAVFDGMGGAGGTVYETPDGPRTGAYLASRVARDVVEQRLVALLDPDWNLDGAATAADLRRSLRTALQERLAELRAPASGLRSRLLRALPTTIAVAALQRRERDGRQWSCHLFWAGDSRVYAFEPGGGACQLTRDDIRDSGDAMANLREDSVVSNAVSADTDFVVHHRRTELTAPFLVMAATDGCFGYVPSPMHFEHLVLASLRDSHDTDGWSAAVQARIGAVTGDDASMAVLGIGADHDTFRALFAPRTAELERRWITPLDGLDADVREQERKLEELREARRKRRAQLWAAYKPGYERHLAPPTTEGTP
ncbi:PP2C family protein-serine/threonine phosphatase [Pseudonocardia lutea]|uniref:PP2C family protein-serine/threonine phosphatase n=1 Tax=Pseudonocardia lutea TaxID=2172015 RepID=A0ABW1I822_9PSEU